MELFKKTCKNLSCGKEFMGTKTQQYCCIECRGSTHKYFKCRTATLDEVARIAKGIGVSYGKYVAMQYNAERKKRK